MSFRSFYTFYLSVSFHFVCHKLCIFPFPIYRPSFFTPLLYLTASILYSFLFLLPTHRRFFSNPWFSPYKKSGVKYSALRTWTKPNASFFDYKKQIQVNGSFFSQLPLFFKMVQISICFPHRWSQILPFFCIL